jgi:beta-lactamase class C
LKIKAIAALCAISFPLACWADDNTKLRAIVDRAILPLMAEYDVPGMAVGVTINGKATVFNYGLASKEKNTPVSDATLFELGSISKIFTATLATRAQVEGVLSFDDHPGKFMPPLRGRAIDKATLRHLGTYTAGGLPLQFPDDVPDDGMVPYFQNWKPGAAPGTVREYSNPSLGLFGHVVALAWRRDFADAMEAQVFPPLGLKHTFIRMPDSAKGDYAWGYNKENKPVRMNPDILGLEAYGVVSSAADMIHFVQVNIDPSGLDAPMRRAVEATHIGYFQIGAMTQGFGWEQYAYPVTQATLLDGNSAAMIQKPNPARALAAPTMAAPATLLNKTGSTNGFGNYIAYVQGKKIGVVILANRNYPIPARVKAGHAILEQLAAHFSADGPH